MIVLFALSLVAVARAQIDCSTVRCAVPPTTCPAGAVVTKTGCCSSCQCDTTSRPSTCPQMRCAYGNAKQTLDNGCCGSCCQTAAPSCAAPPADCSYDTSTAFDAVTGCKTGCGSLVCPNKCANVRCAQLASCPTGQRLVKADPTNGNCCDSCQQICPIADCAAPPAGCTYDGKANIDPTTGCKTGCGSLNCLNKCAAVDCLPSSNCANGQSVIKADPTNGICCDRCQQICPVFDCAAPPAGCSYESQKDANGCATCGKLVCKSNCEAPKCPTLLARANCRTPVSPTDANGACITKCICNELVKLQVTSSQTLDAVTQLIKRAIANGDISVTQTRNGVYQVVVKGDVSGADGDNTLKTFVESTKNALAQVDAIQVSFAEEITDAPGSPSSASTLSITAAFVVVLSSILMN